MLYKQESTLHLVLRLRGGAKKRKKKSYTTPKKNKHKRKKVKLAVLKYYKVRGTTLRRGLRKTWLSPEAVKAVTGLLCGLARLQVLFVNSRPFKQKGN